MKMLVFFLAKYVRTTVKTMVVGRKKPKSTSSAIFGVETAAKSCELKRCADRVRNKFELFAWTLSPNFFRLNWTFRLPPKRQLSIPLNFFSHQQICFWLLLSLLVLLQRGSTCDFAPKTQDSAQGYIQCMPLHIGDPVMRTDGRSRVYYVTTKLSWLDRLPNFLSNGAPLTR